MKTQKEFDDMLRPIFRNVRYGCLVLSEGPRILTKAGIWNGDGKEEAEYLLERVLNDPTTRPYKYMGFEGKRTTYVLNKKKKAYLTFVFTNDLFTPKDALKKAVDETGLEEYFSRPDPV